MTSLTFDTPPAAQAARPGAGLKEGEHASVRLAWQFDAKTGLDRPFQHLVSYFGRDVIMALDQVVLESPVKAAARAAKVFQTYYIEQSKREQVQPNPDQIKSTMVHMANILRPAENVLDDEPLLPPQAVFSGFDRPRG